MNIIDGINDELLNRKTALADRFSSVYAASVGYHWFNLINQQTKIYHEQGRLKNNRLHIMMVAPPGFMKSYLMEQFLDGPYSILHDSLIDTSFLDIVTEAGLVGTVNRGEKGESVVQDGYALTHKNGIIGSDEFSAITGMMKQGHSATLDPALLKLLDTGHVSKQLAAGPLEYTSHFTFWASTQPLRFDLTGGLFRRFLPIEFVPLDHEKDLIRNYRRLGRGRKPEERSLKVLRDAIRSVPERLQRVTRIMWDPALDKYFDGKKKEIPHFEEALYERFALGYTIMENQYNDVIDVQLTDGIRTVLDNLVKWRSNLKRGSASSQVIKVLRAGGGTMDEHKLKNELLDFGIDYTNASQLLRDMLIARMIERQGTIIKLLV